MERRDPFDLERFVKAQDPVFETVLEELRAGRKRTHWMWFIFPQLRGLGKSETSRFYGIVSFPEARAYLKHPVLGERLVRCVESLLACGETSLDVIFGSPDDRKFCSSMTLFALTDERRSNVFQDAIEHFCGGKLDERTASLSSTT